MNWQAPSMLDRALVGAWAILWPYAYLFVGAGILLGVANIVLAIAEKFGVVWVGVL